MVMNPQSPVAPIMNSFPKGGIKKVWPYIVGALVVVLVGVGTAWMISANAAKTSSNEAAPGAKVTSNSAGFLDPNIKYDTATGTLLAGGIGNEGTFHLDRNSGPVNFVYLTSSVVDLSSFLNKKVQVWGETLASKKAGWLMDVSKVQVTP